jgi:D-alanyl-D-alanine carboxypeptidase
MTPMDRANQAKIGSVTKTLLGSVALRVIGDGGTGLTLDDTIDEWYPDVPLADQITVRMLLNMTSGLGEPGQAQLDRICADPYSTITPDEVIAIGAATPRDPYAPGEGFTYSGFNYFLAGRILEKVTGTDLPTLFDELLLDPLGMDRSRFAPDGQLSAPLNRGYSLFCPELPQPTDTTDWYNHESWAAGAMLSTIDDLHTWGLALGEGYGITPELFAARVDDAFVGPAGRQYTYGLGVGVARDLATDCVLDLSHLGAEPGYGAHVQYFTTTGSVFALLGNGDGGTGVASVEVLKALNPVLFPEVTVLPTESCVPPAPTPMPTPTTIPAAPVIALTARPTFTG